MHRNGRDNEKKMIFDSELQVRTDLPRYLTVSARNSIWDPSVSALGVVWLHPVEDLVVW